MKEEKDKRESKCPTSTIHCSQGPASMIYVFTIQQQKYSSALETQIKLLCQSVLFLVKCFTDSESADGIKLSYAKLVQACPSD